MDSSRSEFMQAHRQGRGAGDSFLGTPYHFPKKGPYEVLKFLPSGLHHVFFHFSAPEIYFQYIVSERLDRMISNTFSKGTL